MLKTGKASAHKVHTNEQGVTTVSLGQFFVKIYERKSDKDQWAISYRHGNQLRSETRTGKDRAIERAKQICDMLRQGVPAAANLSAYDIQAFLLCKKLLRSIDGPDIQTAIQEYCGALELLPPNVSLIEAARFFVNKARVVIPISVQDAVEEYLSERKADISERYWIQEKYRLERFSDAFQCEVSTISKNTLRLFLTENLNQISPTTRNHFKNSLKAFCAWCVRRDYLPDDHRLNEELINQRTSQAAPDPYSAEELQIILDNAEGSLRDLMSVLAFTGCRSSEGLRLTWEGIYSKVDQDLIELEAHKTKTQARRLVPFHPALKAFLGESRGERTGLIWTKAPRTFFKDRPKFLRKIGITPRNNGFRDGYISCRVAVVEDVNKVALEVGNSAQMIFRNYRHSISPEEGERWFSIRPNHENQNQTD